MSTPVPPPVLPPRPPSQSATPVQIGTPYVASDWGPRGDGGCHCNGGNCYCDTECLSCLDDEETDKFCVHLDPDVNEKGGIEIELIRIRKYIRVLATIALAVGAVELGVGAYAYGLTDRTQYGAAVGPSGQGWFEKGWGGPSWGKFACAGAWWAGLATILAATISCVCHDRIWFIVSCALNAAACCVSIAGASIDGIYNTWFRSVKTCVRWEGTPTYSTDAQAAITAKVASTFPYWATKGGWQYFGSAAYASEALMCASALSNGYQANDDNFVGRNNMPVSNTAISATTSLSNPNFVENVYAGPLWWYQVLLKSGGTGTESLYPAIKAAFANPAASNVMGFPTTTGRFDPPSGSSCFCKWDNTTVATQGTPTSNANPQTSVPLNFNWDFRTQVTQQKAGTDYYPPTGNNYQQTGATFNAFTNCYQINAGAGLTCNNVVNDGSNIFAVSIAFCCFCAGVTLALSYYNGKAWEWYTTHEEEVLRKQNAKGFGLEGGSVNH